MSERERFPADGPRVPIHGWPGPPPEHCTAERFREMAEAGFTSTFAWFADNDRMAEALGEAGRAGAKLFVQTPLLATDTEATVRRFRGHPAVAGWHLTDEPSAADFPRLAAWARRIEALDPGSHAYINLFPTYASPAQLGAATYREHVERFVDEVPVPILSWDHYPMLATGEPGRSARLREDYYENFEIFTAAARRVGKPFWAFTMTTAHGAHGQPLAYAPPTLAHLRLQAFSDLAYGAQGIQHFTYWTPAPDRENYFELGPLARDGTRTPTYDLVRQLNAEIQGLAPVFLGARVVRVGHTGPPPRGTQPYRPEPPVAAVECGESGALVSLLERGPERFLAVVNRDFDRSAALRVAFDAAARVERVGKDRRRSPVDGEHRETLEPGDLAVFAWRP